MKLFKTLLAAAALFGAGTGAVLAQSTTNFNVTITITEACEFSSTAPTNVSFPTVERGTLPADAQGTLVVDCSPNTEYSIGLNGGENYDGSGSIADPGLGGRRMVFNGEFVPYDLFRTASGTDFWGNTAPNLYTGTGDGAGQSVTVYGQITATDATDVPAGTYTDTVTATLTF